MSLTLDEIRVSNRWASETDPATWTKSSILDQLTIECDFTSSADLTAGELMMNAAMFRDVGTPYTGNTRPTRGFYLANYQGGSPGTYNLVETGILGVNSNYITAEVDVISTTEFTIRFSFRMLADRNDFFNTITMASIDQVLKNSIDATNILENVVDSVYNKVKELQLYVYVKESGGTESTLLVRQQIQAKYYGDDANFSWDGNEYCAIYQDNDFAFSFAPVATGIDSDFYSYLFDNDGDDDANYVSDLNFSETAESGMAAAGGSYTKTFSDYSGRYYTAIIYNLGGISYTQIEEELVSECLPVQPALGVYGHIADYLGGDSSLVTPCTNAVNPPVHSLYGVNTWWRPLRNLDVPIGFHGDVTDKYPGGGTYYAGAFPVDGYIYEYYLGVPSGSFQAKASPVGVFEFQHDADPATCAANFAALINTYHFASWTAVIDGSDDRIVHMVKVSPSGYQSSLYQVGYQIGATPFSAQTPEVIGTDASSLIIEDYMTTGALVTTTITWDDSPYDDNLDKLLEYINTQTIYTGTEDSDPDFYICLSPGIYEDADIALSSIEIITRVTPAHAEEKEVFGGTGGEHEDNTEQVVSERLEATAKILKSVYDDKAATSDYFTDLDTDLKKIIFEINGIEYEAVRSGSSWLSNNPKLTIEDDGTDIICIFKFRGLFENEQGIADWSGLTIPIKWTFILEYETPKIYQHRVEYNQQVKFFPMDMGGGNAGEVFNGFSFVKDGGGTLNSLCEADDFEIQVQSNNFLEDPDIFDLVALIDAEPYGVTTKSENNVEEEDSWTISGQLEQLSTEKITVTQKDFTSTIAKMDIHVDELDNLRYKVYALAYGEMPPPPDALGDIYNDFDIYFGVNGYTTGQGDYIMRIYRDSDMAEDFFYPDADNRLSLTSQNGGGTDLATWIGGASGFVAGWYDPINGNYPVQAAAGSMPQIIDNGALITYQGRAAVDFLEGTTTWLEASTLEGGTLTQPFTIFAAWKAPSDISAGTSVIVAANGSTNKALLQLNNEDIRLRFGSAFNQDHGWLNEEAHICYALVNGASSETGIDEDAEVVGDAGSSDFDQPVFIGNSSSGPQDFRGLMSEISLAGSDKSAQRIGIVQNMNDRLKYYT